MMFSGFRSRCTILPLVRGGETAGKLRAQLDGLARWQSAPLERRSQRLTLQQFGEDVGRAVDAADVEYREDVQGD